MTSRFCLYCFLVLLFIATACNAKNLSTSDSDSLSKTRPPNIEETASEKNANNVWVINDQFRNALLEKGFAIHSPENIEKPNIIDNIKRIKPFFKDNDELFFSYSVLSRHIINKKNSNISARLYCFQFSDNEQAFKWFDVVDKMKEKGNRRFVVFSKPKKLMALSENKIFLLEGYHISNFDALNFIIDQLKNVQVVLGPKTTTKR
jgi:hypothetical protein